MTTFSPIINNKIFQKKEIILLGLFYGAILSIIFFRLPTWLSIFVLIASYILSLINDISLVMFFPFVIYPFLFLIRAPDETNTLLIALPDIMAFLAVCFYFTKSLSRRRISTRYLKLSYLIGIHALLTIIICFIHISDFSFLPILLRQFLLPLVFLMVIIRASLRESSFPSKALALSIFSFMLVSCIALLNAAQVINFKFIELQPFITNIDTNEHVFERSFFSLISLPRLNLLTGGALGSAAAVLIALSIICFIGSPPKFNKMLSRFSGLIFLISALWTGSTSILTPICIFIYLLFLKGKSKYKKVGIIMIIVPILIWILFFSTLFLDQSPITYFTSNIGIGIMNFVQALDPSSFFFGVGPRITAKGYEFMPAFNFIIDVGMFRVFVETGIFNFILFASIIIFLFSQGVKIITGSDANQKISFILLFFTFCLLVHANFSLLPPFYPLFAASSAGILANKSKQFCVNSPLLVTNNNQ